MQAFFLFALVVLSTSYGQNILLAADNSTPIILNLSGKIPATLTATQAKVRFDGKETDKRALKGLLGKGSAFLVHDLNRNGMIDSDRELFGNTTLDPNGRAYANGFEALKDWDSDRDGRITKKDKNFGKLALWFDHNGNGLTDKGELVSLRKARITFLSTKYKEDLQAAQATAVHNSYRFYGHFGGPKKCPQGVCSMVGVQFGTYNNGSKSKLADSR